MSSKNNPCSRAALHKRPAVDQSKRGREKKKRLPSFYAASNNSTSIPFATLHPWNARIKAIKQTLGKSLISTPPHEVVMWGGVEDNPSVNLCLPYQHTTAKAGLPPLYPAAGKLFGDACHVSFEIILMSIKLIFFLMRMICGM